MSQRRIISLPPRLSQERWSEPSQPEENDGNVPKQAGKVPLVLLLAFVVVVVFAIYSYWSISNKTDSTIKNLKQSAQSTNNSQVLIDKVSRLILLPKNEPPSIATINNVVLLQKDSSFYRDAHNGDVLLIYFQAKKAFIYNPTENIVVNVGPLILEKNTPGTPVVVSTSTTSTSN